MTVTDWNRVAEQFSKLREESRLQLVFPFVRDLLVERGVKTLLDYGGGDGRFALSLKLAGISHIAVYDPSEQMRSLAQEICAGNDIRILAALDHLHDHSFDAVTLNAVWMCLETESAVRSVFHEAQRLLAPGGALIASVTHPCFRENTFSTFSTEFRNEDYLRNGTQFAVRVSDGTDLVTLRDTHWNLSAMSRQLAEAGFSIDRLFELPDLPSAAPHGVSPWLIITARGT